MKTQKGRFPLRPRVLLLTSLLAATSGYSIDVSAQGVDLLARYPTTLTGGETSTCTRRTWEFTEADVFRLTGFSFRVGDAVRVEVGSADLGIGHSVDGAVWAVIIPRTGGILTSQPIDGEEAIASALLSFHPKVISQLFPPATVFSDGNGSRISQIRALAQLGVGSPACILEPKHISLNVETKDGERRWFPVNTDAQTAEFISQVGDRPALRLRGQWPAYRRGFAYAVAVAGNLAYVAAVGPSVMTKLRMVVNPVRVAGVLGASTA